MNILFCVLYPTEEGEWWWWNRRNRRSRRTRIQRRGIDMPVQQTIASEVQNAMQPLLESFQWHWMECSIHFSVYNSNNQEWLTIFWLSLHSNFFFPTIKDTPRPNTVHSLGFVKCHKAHLKSQVYVCLFEKIEGGISFYIISNTATHPI